MIARELSKLHIAIIGCGRVAEHYLNILNSDKMKKLFKVDACMDIKSEKSEKLAEKFDCSAFSDLDTMFGQSKASLYLVLTPSGSHFEIARKLLINAKNVLIEKPGTLLTSDSQTLMKLATQHSCFLGCVHQNRYNLAVKTAYDFIHSGSLGKVTNFSVKLRWHRNQSYYEDGWHGTWAMDGGVISQQAFHHLDIIRFLLGEAEDVVSFGDKRSHQLEAEDTSVAILKMQSGALGNFIATTTTYGGDKEASIEVFGDHGHIIVGGIALNEIVAVTSSFLSSSKLNKIKKCSEEVQSGYGLGHKGLLEEVREKLLLGQHSYSVNWEDSIKTLELIHSLYSSQESRKVVSVSERKQSIKLGVNH